MRFAVSYLKLSSNMQDLIPYFLSISGRYTKCTTVA
jgi:hypothetical protein